VGKGSVVRKLLERDRRLFYSVSAKTRAPRPGEVEGRDYRFVPFPEFQRLIEKDAFLEWAEVFGHRYGTLRTPIAAELERGRNAILEIDVQGAAAVRAKMPEAVLIFLAPPSDQELERRLRARRTESGPELERRLAAARSEMDQRSWFDHVVVNDEVDRAAAEVAAIIDGAAEEERS
jgi:guanylate kinase